jgi:hypothetical protein
LSAPVRRQRRLDGSTGPPSGLAAGQAVQQFAEQGVLAGGQEAVARGADFPPGR